MGTIWGHLESKRARQAPSATRGVPLIRHLHRTLGPLGRVKQSSADEGRARSHETCINYLGEIAWTERGPSGRWNRAFELWRAVWGRRRPAWSYNCEICVRWSGQHHESLFKMYVVCVTEEWCELGPKLSFMPHQLMVGELKKQTKRM